MDFTLYLPLTSLSAIINGALLVFMTSGIALFRRRHNISYGDNGHGQFAKRIRGHMNGVEQIPIALILMALAEIQGATTGLLAVVLVCLSVGRLFHAIQFWAAKGPFLLRPIGVVLTLLAQIIAIVWLALNVVY